MNNITINKKAIRPKLRFNQFKDNWSKSELRELLFQIVDCEHKTAPYVEKSDYFVVCTNNVREGKLFFEDIKYTDKSSFEEWTKRSLPEFGDILFTREAPAGELCMVPRGLKVCLGQRMVLLKPNVAKANGKYLSYYLQSPNGIKDINSYIIGTTVTRINIADVKKIVCYYSTLPEQQKIASFISTVDEKIQLLTRKKELLEQYKKGVMQQLFSGKLRFKDEKGKAFPKWEEKRLGDVCTFFSGGTPTSTNKKFYSGTIPFIGSGNIYDAEVATFISEEALNSSSAKIVEQGDLLYALYGANSGEVAISKIKGAINQAILCIRSEESIEYLYYVLFLNKERIVSKYLQGGQGNLSSNIVKQLKYYFPSSQEQKKIANYLSNIDIKIEIINNQITQSQIFKKGLLQKMFV